MLEQLKKLKERIQASDPLNVLAGLFLVFALLFGAHTIIKISATAPPEAKAAQLTLRGS